MILRPCTQADLPQALALFYETVHRSCASDYTPAQLDAWAPADIAHTSWAEKIRLETFLLAEEGGSLWGFAALDENYLDLLYVHPDRQRRGVATVLCDTLERQCTGPRLTVHASITARPFFARRGYGTMQRRQVERRGQTLTNYLMEKELILWT